MVIMTMRSSKVYIFLTA